MVVVVHGAVRLDLCRGCGGAWFDQGELEEIWNQTFDRALQKRQLPRSNASEVARDVGGEAALNMLFYAPDLVGHGFLAAGAVVESSASALANLPAAAEAAPEAASLILEATAEAAGSVFEVIVSVIAGILEGL